MTDDDVINIAERFARPINRRSLPSIMAAARSGDAAAITRLRDLFHHYIGHHEGPKTLDQCRDVIMANDSTPQDRAAALEALEVMIKSAAAHEQSERRSEIAKSVWRHRKAVAA